MLRHPWVKVIVFLGALAPAGILGWRFWQQDLTPNPLEFIEHFTGDWTIRLLVITLSITPLRRLFRLPDLIRFRRMIGLFTFFYGSLHFLAWLWFDRLFNVHEIVRDVGKRPFITAGFTALVLMLPLALTSTKRWIRRLGGRRWQALHRLIYISGIAAVVHYYWLVKSDIRLPVFYGSLVAVLLAARAIHWIAGRRVQENTAAGVRATSY
ncbi:MAG TPA: protein-methionine-sulfoxide reductase heme-binding subunit MsrQ [Bryobacteraceae bacterium]|nr:protein-methionine-sulfoxide reductase heme-binding subunit MsrQ [Bryobacteraceae bacterium]